MCCGILLKYSSKVVVTRRQCSPLLSEYIGVSDLYVVDSYDLVSSLGVDWFVVLFLCDEEVAWVLVLVVVDEVLTKNERSLDGQDRDL